MAGGAKKGLIAIAAGAILLILGKKLGKPQGEELAKADFKISTGRMGVRFSEKIRDVFRLRWIKRR